MENELNPQKELDFLIDDNTTISIASTIYIIKDGKVLLMKQTKPHSIVGEYYVGIGGKTPIKTYLNGDKEKVQHDEVVSSMLSGTFAIQEPIEELAIREVNEEVGLTLKKEKLQDIGITEVRLLNQKSNELWYIKNYVYSADGTEGEMTESDEGILEFVPVEEIKTKPMLPHDRIIFGEKNPTLYIQSMNDSIHNNHQLRIHLKKQNQGMYILLSNLELRPIDVKGIITKETDEIPEEYQTLKSSIPESKLKQYLKMLGISEQIIGTIDKYNLPINLDEYFL